MPQTNTSHQLKNSNLKMSLVLSNLMQQLVNSANLLPQELVCSESWMDNKLNNNLVPSKLLEKIKNSLILLTKLEWDHQLDQSLHSPVALTIKLQASLKLLIPGLELWKPIFKNKLTSTNNGNRTNAREALSNKPTHAAELNMSNYQVL